MRLAWIAPLLAAAAAGCGTSESERFSLRTPGTDDPVVRESATPEKAGRGKPTAREVRVIRGWADALRAGKVKQASSFFALPATVLDGANPLRTLDDRATVRAFNDGLPCGAELVRTKRGTGAYVEATFKLTNRRGSPDCTGAGRLATTGFLIRGRLIVEWLRRPNPRQPRTQSS